MKQSINLLRQTIKRSKTVTFTLALLVTFFLSSFASPSRVASPAHEPRIASSVSPNDDLNTQVRISFEKDFKNTRLLSSEVHKNFTKLTFKMNDVVLFAFYSDNGELMAVVRNILSSQLPVNLLTDIRNNYAGFWITDLFELNRDKENCYYVTLENAGSKVILRSSDHDLWEVFEKTSKK